MDLQVESFRNREELAADLAELSMVDWSQVWPGYSQADPRTWCAQRGWKLERLNRVEDITARLGSGGLLYLQQDRQAANPVPVTSAVLDCWRAEAQSAADNGALFPAAEAAWSGYVTGAAATVGRPAVATSFDDPAFPDLRDWPPQKRASWRMPYRLAMWPFRGASAQFYVGPSADSLAADQPGGIQIALLLRASRLPPRSWEGQRTGNASRM